jgi:hypothetical protein
MSMQENTAGARAARPRADTERRRSPNAHVTNSSPDDMPADAWLDGNPHLVETNTFFALPIESDENVKGAPGRKERKWVPSIWSRRESARAVRA